MIGPSKLLKRAGLLCTSLWLPQKGLGIPVKQQTWLAMLVQQLLLYEKNMMMTDQQEGFEQNSDTPRKNPICPWTFLNLPVSIGAGFMKFCHHMLCRLRWECTQQNSVC
jgi:hypothetical protein